MNRLVRVSAIIALLGSVPVTAQDPARLFRAAMNREMVDGDLRAAIEQYRKVSESGDRALAAQALVRMAECHQKLGDREASRIFERIVREYGEQQDAVAIARARLARSSMPGRLAEMRMRKLLDIENRAGYQVSRDGRFLFYMDRETGDLAIHEFASGADRRLTNKGSWAESNEFAESSAISRDGTRLAYSWFNGKDRYDVRVANMTASGLVQFRRVFDDQQVTWIYVADWSADGKRIVVMFNRGDGVERIGWLSPDDGSLQEVKSGELRGGHGFGRLTVSPDGQYLAFDVPVDEQGAQRDVFISEADGGRNGTAFSHPGRDTVVGWSPDGKQLLFASDHGGSQALWTLSVANGRVQAAPQLIKPDIGEMSSLGVSAAGNLYFGTNYQGQNVFLASVDFSTGQLLTPPARLPQAVSGNHRWADWSPDGKSLLYKAELPGRFALVIHSAESGEVLRRVQPQMGNLMALPRWAADGRSIFARGTDLAGRSGIYRIDANTGATTSLVLTPGPGPVGPDPSPDGTKIYYGHPAAADGTVTFVERDLASGAERAVVRRMGLGFPVLSPDGRTIATAVSDAATKSSAVLLISADSGEIRELARAVAPEWFGPQMTWTADARQLIVRKEIADGRNSPYSPYRILLMPVSGDPPRHLDLQIPNVTQSPIRVHPDGRRIAFGAISHAGNRGFREVWVLENFLK